MWIFSIQNIKKMTKYCLLRIRGYLIKYEIKTGKGV